MSVGAIVALLISGGVITELLRAGRDFLRDSQENKKELRKRQREVADRGHTYKKEAYVNMLEELNGSALRKFASAPDHALSQEEIKKRTANTTAFAIHGSHEAKAGAAKVASYLKRDLTNQEKIQMIAAIQELTDQIKKELNEEG